MQEYETVEKFRKKALDTLGSRIHSIILYGSVARGSDAKDSDIDILVIGKEKKDWEEISRIAYEIDFENGFRTFITTLFMTRDEFERNLKAGDPFIYSVLEEGVVLYDSGFYGRVRKSLLEARRRNILRMINYH